MEIILYIVGLLMGLVILVKYIAKYAYIGGKGDESAERNKADTKTVNKILSTLQGKLPGITSIASRWRDRM